MIEVKKETVTIAREIQGKCPEPGSYWRSAGPELGEALQWFSLLYVSWGVYPRGKRKVREKTVLFLPFWNCCCVRLNALSACRLLCRGDVQISRELEPEITEELASSTSIKHHQIVAIHYTHGHEYVPWTICDPSETVSADKILVEQVA